MIPSAYSPAIPAHSYALIFASSCLRHSFSEPSRLAEASGGVSTGSSQRVATNVRKRGLLSWLGGKVLEHFCNVLIKLLGVSIVIGGEIFGRETAPQDLL